jgi:hypothetical protein
VIGQTLLTDVGITGTVTDGVMTINGLDENEQASINTVGNLKLQNEGAGGIDILSGKILIDTNGNFVSQGQVTAMKYNVNTSNVQSASLGRGIITFGQTQAVINSTAVTNNSEIFITPTTVTTRQYQLTVSS